MSIFFQIDIPKRSQSCSEKGERLLPGMEYYSLLRENDNGQISRQDFCVACWEQFSSQQDLSNSSGYWKSKIEPKKAAPSSRSEKALTLLKSLLGQAAQHEEEIFVLIIFLSHARRLALRQEFESEGATWGLYEILQHEEFIRAKILPISQIEIVRIQQAIAEKLSHMT
ncbi:hypothetical protein [Candidatus Protochlamydia phocaeensis]|uniref:hypothetical protein n=1 Tax=Candidatus Protochlamydia phocaeensis TaxID=1414722 RepID=UPI000838C33F|nr:hypothetical protein [Candidatus Protochlamydia phocaeensis]